MKIYDGTTWQEAKSVKVHTGSGWASAIKGWVYNNGWQLAYPNYPILVSGPTLAISGTPYPTVGTTYSANSTWNMDAASAPTSYSYKWFRSGSQISGATSPTYVTTVLDVDKVISVEITATNARGNTVVRTDGSGAIILPTVPILTAYDATLTPSAPVVSISASGLSYSGSWSSSNATYCEISSTNGSVSPTVGGASGNYSGSGTAGQVRVFVTPVNTSKKVYMTWSEAPGAVSYDVVKYGNNVQTTINVPSTQFNYTWDLADDNPNNYISVYPRTAAGYQGYGIQTIVLTSNKTGTAAYAETYIADPAPSIPNGLYGSDNVNPTGGTFYWNASSSPRGASVYYSYVVYYNYGVPYTSGTTFSTSVSVPASGSFYITVTATDGVYSSSAASSGLYSFTSKAAAPSAPSGVYGSDNISPTGGNFYWTASNDNGGGAVTYYYTINRNGSFYTSGSTSGTSVEARVAGNMSISVFARNSIGDSPIATGSGTFTTVVVAPTISASNSYDGRINNKYQWTLTITNTSSSAATSFSWGVQFSNSSGGSVTASTSGSGGSIPAGGSVTITRNDATATWARWVNISASNSAGSSSTTSTAWS